MTEQNHVKEKLNTILITGDITIDNYVYEGEKFYSKADEKRPVQSVTKLGGSYLVYKILKEIQKNNSQDQWDVHHSTSHLNNGNSISLQSSYSIWKPFPNKDSKQSYWRMSQALGYGKEPDSEEIKTLLIRENLISQHEAMPNILVINDGGFRFREKENNKFWTLSENIDWIVLKITSPIGTGDLWYGLSRKYSQKLITIISADELRIDGAKIGKGYSWEQTIEDTLDSIYNLSNLQKLLLSRHLIINYSMDGALWIDNKDAKNRKTTLIYDSSRSEGEFEHGFQGKAFGYMSVFTAGIVNSLITENDSGDEINLFKGIQSALGAIRNLIDQGHGTQDESERLGFPAKRIAEQILNPKYLFSRSNIPFTKPVDAESKGKWMIVDLVQHTASSKQKVSLFGLASQIVLKGTKVLNNVPHARFGKLVSVDRSEIETLRQLRGYMIDYKENKKINCPISFGIFGPPGAGKSFGVKQIANDIFGKESWLEFNLSQFNGAQELNSAFHQIRDLVLTGVTPIAFWDEFDSKNYFWLQYFLAPMQSGTFQEGQLNHTVGKCIFIFAGATSHTFESFGEFKTDAGREREFILMKGPDFKSRLDSYYNVLGPNQRVLNIKTGKPDPSDTTLHLRRAIFISTKINYTPYLPAEVDSGLINALLSISKYKHGARSFDKLLTILQSKDRTKLEHSLLPLRNQLAMYVDPDEFEKLILEKRIILRQLPIEALASAIHESFRENCRRRNQTVKERFNKSFSELTEEDKEDNRAAARRMQEILSLVGLNIIKKSKSVQLEKEHELNINSHLEYHLELLAEAEHNGWMKQRINAGWKYGKERNDVKKIHPDLIPYHKLESMEQEKDLDSIRGFYQKLKEAGYIIDWM